MTSNTQTTQRAPDIHNSTNLQEITTNTVDTQLLETTRSDNKPSARHVAKGLAQTRIEAELELSSASKDFQQRIVRTAAFAAMTPQEKLKFIDLTNVLIQSGSRSSVESSLLALSERLINGEPALLQKDLGTGRSTLLENFSSLAHSSLISPLADKKTDILMSLLEETANPEININQGKKYASCVVTTALTTMAARKNPSEYARLVKDLATNGSARLAGAELAGSPEMELSYVPWSSTRDALSHRSITESLLQTSALKATNAVKQGVSRGDAETFYEALFATQFNRLDSEGMDFHQFLSAIRNNSADSNGINMLSMKWAREGSGIHLNHAVEIISADGAEVRFRNPMGSEFKIPEYLNVRVVGQDDEGKAIYAISTRALYDRCNYLLVADANASFGKTPGWERDSGGPTFFIYDDSYARRKEREEKEKQEKMMAALRKTHASNPEISLNDISAEKGLTTNKESKR